LKGEFIDEAGSATGAGDALRRHWVRCKRASRFSLHVRRTSTLRVAGHEIVRIVVRKLLKAQPLIEPIGSLVLQGNRKQYLFPLLMPSSNRIRQNSSANAPVLVTWLYLDLTNFDPIWLVKNLNHTHSHTINLDD
jgi:hypothetical protein